VPKIVVLCVALLLSATRPAEAYIDPGSGSLAFQVLVTSVLGAMVFLRRIRSRLMAAARKLLSRGCESPPRQPR